MIGTAPYDATLRLTGLSVSYGSGPSRLRAVRDVSFAIAPGEAYGLIGESGSGKTTLAFAVMRYLSGGHVENGDIVLKEQSVLSMSERALERMRGRVAAMVFQDPMNALNPMIRIGEQVAEAIRRHLHLNKHEAMQRTLDLLAKVHLPSPEQIARRYPHQLSGGQQQRVVIAMALSCEPDLLIMDEPTTGLDVTTEAVILDLVAALRRSLDVSILFISHNLGVVAKVCDRIGVLYAGELVEEGSTGTVLETPKHPYTVGLVNAMPSVTDSRDHLEAIPGSLIDLREVPVGCIFAPRCWLARTRCHTDRPQQETAGLGHSSRCFFIPEVRNRPPSQHGRSPRAPASRSAKPLLQITKLKKHYPQQGGVPFVAPKPPPVRAVERVSLAVGASETVAIVGESGCGKSTLARCVVGLVEPTSGDIAFDGEPLAPNAAGRSRALQRSIQIIFQNPEASLNPHHNVSTILSRPLKLYHRMSGAALRRRTVELLEAVKLNERYADRYPRQLSGGEKQRVCVARAFAAEPRLIICDEPTSALDISVQAAVLNELVDLQQRFGTSYLFISHDLGVVRHIADRLAIMYLGLIVEEGPTAGVFSPPHHPYTEALLAAVPSATMRRQPSVRLRGVVPNPAFPPTGCVFHTRCPRKIGSVCEKSAPPVRNLGAGRAIACHIPVAELESLQKKTMAAGLDAKASGATPLSAMP